MFFIDFTDHVDTYATACTGISLGGFLLAIIILMLLQPLCHRKPKTCG